MTRVSPIPDERRRRSWRGLSYIEVIAACAVLLVLASAVVPMYHWNEKRLREKQLKMALATMREAIDKYKEYFDQGLISPLEERDLESMGYPPSLDTLVEGVELMALDQETAENRVLRFLYEIPVDPFTGEREWGMRSYRDDWDSTSWGGEDVYDVYSLSDLVALDGTYYNEW